ncbi:MAG: flavodoxin family protein [Desulfobacterales bacterium]
MKILGLVCSPRKEGNTEILVTHALASAREAGAQTEMLHVADLNIAPCDACGACTAEGTCIVEDDMQTVYEQLLAADGVIFGTPVYFLNVSAQAKAIIDRTYAFLMKGKLRGKVAAVLVAARRVGAGQVLSLMYTYFSAQRMIIAGGGVGYGREKGEVNEGPGMSPFLSAIEEAKAVGRNVVKMRNSIG